MTKGGCGWEKHICYNHMWEFIPSEGVCMIKCSRCKEEKKIDSKNPNIIKSIKKYNFIHNNGDMI